MTNDSSLAEGVSAGWKAQLIALGRVLEGIENRLIEASQRVAEADGRLDREVDRLDNEVMTAIQDLRNDVAATMLDIRGWVERQLLGLALLPELRSELLERIVALETEVQELRASR